MSDFPKWLLALAAVSLLPVLAVPFYLFGAMPFGTSESGIVRFLLYLATQLLWAVPLTLFFVSLDAWRRGYERRSVGLAVLGAVVSLGGGCLIFL